MGLITLEHDEAREYIRKLDRILDTVKTIVPDIVGHVDQVISAITLFEVGQFLRQFQSLKIDDVSGMPSYAHMQDFRIEKSKSDAMLAALPRADEIIDDIVSKLYNNNFRISTQARQLQEVIFYTELRSLDLFYDKLIKLERFDERESEFKYSITIKGYDLAKMTWMVYFVDALEKKNTWGRNFVHKDGYVQEEFRRVILDAFSYGPRQVFNNLSSLNGLAPTSIKTYLLKGFYYKALPQDAELSEIAAKPDSFIFELQENQLEDTGLFLTDELDKDALSKRYKPDVLEFPKIIYICSPNIEDDLRRFVITRPYETTVLPLAL